MTSNERLLVVAAIMIAVVVFAILFQRMVDRRRPKRKYGGKLTSAVLASADTGTIAEFRQPRGLEVGRGGFVAFSHMSGDKGKVESATVVLGASHYLYCSGLSQKPCDFSHYATVKLFAPGKLILVTDLAGCTLSGNCVTGYSKDGIDICIVFGDGLTATIVHH